MKRLAGLLPFSFVVAFGSALHADSLETIATSEFLKLPEDFQAVYVAGILDGMSYVTYNYDIPDHERFTACVRTTTLSQTLTEVLRYLKENPSEEQYPLPWAVAKTIGQRSCAAKP